jgi:hypothetical protein
MTRKQAIEIIKRTHYGGTVPVDASHTDREVNLMLNMGISVVAIRAYRENININNEDVINDAFYVTLSNLIVDANGEIETSYTPIGVNIGIALSNLIVTGLEKQPIPLAAKEVFLWNELSNEKGRAAYYINGSKIKFLSKVPMVGKSVSVRVAGVPDTNNLEDELSVPSEQLSSAIEYVVALLDKRRQEDFTSRTGKE